MIELAQVVEDDLGLETPESIDCRWILGQIAKQTVAQPTVRHAPELFLHRLQRLAGSEPATLAEHHRVHGCEPADRPRQVHVVEKILSPVAFEVDQDCSPRPDSVKAWATAVSSASLIWVL